MTTNSPNGARTAWLLRGVARGVQRLHPVSFAMVMATGIVSIAGLSQGMRTVAVTLTVLNALIFVVLTAMTIARAIFYPRALFQDLVDHTRGMDFLTTVAGACVLGTQFVLVLDHGYLAGILWKGSLVLWIVLNYSIFAAFTIKERKPHLAEGINSGWLISVVSTQALAELTLLLAPAWTAHRGELILLALLLWLAGGMLYIWIISLIFYRYTFFHLAPSDLMPPYWIDMGAMAISALVGAALVSHSEEPLLAELTPFLKGLTLLFWATATWWIPMLVILAVWRHAAKRLRFIYNPLYWGAVFPLGMYAVATQELADVAKLRFLLWIPRYFTWLALLAWLAAFAGLLRSLVSFDWKCRVKAEG